MSRTLLAVVTFAGPLLAAPLLGCNNARYMQYDFGRASTQAFAAQADLSRPAAATADYPLQGNEAAAIRLNATQVSSEAKTGESELKNDDK